MKGHRDTTHEHHLHMKALLRLEWGEWTWSSIISTIHLNKERKSISRESHKCHKLKSKLLQLADKLFSPHIPKILFSPFTEMSCRKLSATNEKWLCCIIFQNNKFFFITYGMYFTHIGVYIILNQSWHASLPTYALNDLGM